MDGGICNFWRALRDDPEAVAYWADYPTIHHDLTARHRWLVRWVRDNAERLCDDPEYYDAQAAGWWVWGISLWIGGGWCQEGKRPDLRPHVQTGVGGRGVNAQVEALPDRDGKMPLLDGSGGGRGVNAQRAELPGHDKRPLIHVPGSGRGVSAQRDALPRDDGQMPMTRGMGGASGVNAQRVAAPGDAVDGTRLRPWMEALAVRLARVVVLNRSWESAVTLTVLAQTGARKPSVGILMDPPYLTADRARDIYGSDISGHSDDVAQASYGLAVPPADHGDPALSRRPPTCTGSRTAATRGISRGRTTGRSARGRSAGSGTPRARRPAAIWSRSARPACQLKKPLDAPSTPAYTTRRR